jgi:hypothetical protein
MITIFVTGEAYAAIGGEKPDPAAYGRRGYGLPLMLAPKTLAKGKAARGPGENYSDVILRLAKGEAPCWVPQLAP